MSTIARLAVAAAALTIAAPASAQSVECFTASTSIEVPAPIDIVWDTLTDSEGYVGWNPYIV